MEALETERNLAKGFCVCTKVPLSKMNQCIEMRFCNSQGNILGN